MFEERFFDVGKLNLHYVTGPKTGPPLLLLHGWYSHWQSFLSMMPVLSIRWHVYALDFRGHGRSEWSDDGYTVKNYTEDVVSFIDGVIGEPPIVFGHSLGGMVGISVAAQSRLRGLIIGDSPLYLDSIWKTYGEKPGGTNPVAELVRSDIPTSEFVCQLSTLMPGFDAVSIRYRAKLFRQVDPRVFIPMQQLIQGYDCSQLLPKVGCPTLILQVDHITDEDVERAICDLSDGCVLRYKDLSHDLQNGLNGTRVTVDVAKFLESL